MRAGGAGVVVAAAETARPAAALAPLRGPLGRLGIGQRPATWRLRAGDPAEFAVTGTDLDAAGPNPSPLGHLADGAPLVVRDQGDYRTGFAGAGGTAGAMQVALLIRRWVHVHH